MSSSTSIEGVRSWLHAKFEEPFQATRVGAILTSQILDQIIQQWAILDTNQKLHLVLSLQFIKKHSFNSVKPFIETIFSLISKENDLWLRTITDMITPAIISEAPHYSFESLESNQQIRPVIASILAQNEKSESNRFCPTIAAYLQNPPEEWKQAKPPVFSILKPSEDFIIKSREAAVLVNTSHSTSKTSALPLDHSASMESSMFSKPIGMRSSANMRYSGSLNRSTGVVPFSATSAGLSSESSHKPSLIDTSHTISNLNDSLKLSSSAVKPSSAKVQLLSMAQLKAGVPTSNKPLINPHKDTKKKDAKVTGKQSSGTAKKDSNLMSEASNLMETGPSGSHVQDGHDDAAHLLIGVMSQASSSSAAVASSLINMGSNPSYSTGIATPSSTSVNASHESDQPSNAAPNLHQAPISVKKESSTKTIISGTHAGIIHSSPSSSSNYPNKMPKLAEGAAPSRNVSGISTGSIGLSSAAPPPPPSLDTPFMNTAIGMLVGSNPSSQSQKPSALSTPLVAKPTGLSSLNYPPSGPAKPPVLQSISNTSTIPASKSFTIPGQMSSTGASTIIGTSTSNLAPSWHQQPMMQQQQQQQPQSKGFQQLYQPQVLQNFQTLPQMGTTTFQAPLQHTIPPTPNPSIPPLQSNINTTQFNVGGMMQFNNNLQAQQMHAQFSNPTLSNQASNNNNNMIPNPNPNTADTEAADLLMSLHDR